MTQSNHEYISEFARMAKETNEKSELIVLLDETDQTSKCVKVSLSGIILTFTLVNDPELELPLKSKLCYMLTCIFTCVFPCYFLIKSLFGKKSKKTNQSNHTKSILLTQIESVLAIDPYTVRIRLTKDDDNNNVDVISLRCFFIDQLDAFEVFRATLIDSLRNYTDMQEWQNINTANKKYPNRSSLSKGTHLVNTDSFTATHQLNRTTSNEQLSVGDHSASRNITNDNEYVTNCADRIENTYSPMSSYSSIENIKNKMKTNFEKSSYMRERSIAYQKLIPYQSNELIPGETHDSTPATISNFDIKSENGAYSMYPSFSASNSATCTPLSLSAYKASQNKISTLKIPLSQQSMPLDEKSICSTFRKVSSLTSTSSRHRARDIMRNVYQHIGQAADVIVQDYLTEEIRSYE